MAIRQIIKIDEDLCDGCGLCVPSCDEGAIQIIDGKAKLVGEQLCDGLGACLGDCPQGALTIEERDADEFNEEAVRKHLTTLEPSKESATPAPIPIHGGGCPSAQIRMMQQDPAPRAKSAAGQPAESALTHWPVKIQLVPPTAPFLRDADLLLAADCTAVSTAAFHSEVLPGHVVIIGCPKFDDYRAGVEKLALILRDSGVRSLTVVHMEVPCCFGYKKMAAEAMKLSGRDLPIKSIVVTAQGELRYPSEDEVSLPMMTARRPR